MTTWCDRCGVSNKEDESVFMRVGEDGLLTRLCDDCYELIELDAVLKEIKDL